MTFIHSPSLSDTLRHASRRRHRHRRRPRRYRSRPGKADRPGLKAALDLAREGDVLIVWKLDRLGRNLSDLIRMLDGFKERGIAFRSLTEAIDTETPTGRAMWQMIGVLAELERSLITERTRAGVKAAQRRGVKFGRKPKLTPDRLTHARKLIDQGKTPTEAAKIMGVGRATLYGALQREAE